jgi:hypothetical protein
MTKWQTTFELSPETEDGLLQIFNKIYNTGEPFKRIYGSTL